MRHPPNSAGFFMPVADQEDGMGAVSGTLGTTGGVLDGVTLIRTFNVDFGRNATGVVVLERSFDGGAAPRTSNGSASRS